MKKRVFFVLPLLTAVLLFGNAEAQVRAITIPDEAERNHLRAFFSYDDTQRKTEMIEQRWLETGAWSNDRRHTYSRENDGRTLITVMQYWENGTWNNATREMETFDSDNDRTSRTRDIWQTRGVWTHEQRDIFTYNDNGQKIEWRSQLRDEGGNWYYNWRFTYSYNDDGNIVEETFQNWNRSRWEIETRITNSYNDEGEKTDRIIYKPRGRSLEENQAIRYEYNNEHGLAEKLSVQRWTGSSWQDVTTEQYEYDDEGRLIKTEYYAGNILTARDIYVYDDEEKTTRRIREERQPNGSVREEWQYIYTYDFRGYMSSRSYLEYRAGAWIEQYRTNYSYDIYGNRTLSITQQ